MMLLGARKIWRIIGRISWLGLQKQKLSFFLCWDLLIWQQTLIRSQKSQPSWLEEWREKNRNVRRKKEIAESVERQMDARRAVDGNLRIFAGKKGARVNGPARRHFQSVNRLVQILVAAFHLPPFQSVVANKTSAEKRR